MWRALGLVGLIIVGAIGFYIYTRQLQSVTPAGANNPRAAIDLTGVKNDLLAIAQAERSHFALESKYVSLDELRSGGDLKMDRTSRGPYNYSVETSENSFRVVATYSGPEAPGMPRIISIDDTMQLSQQ